MFAPPRARSHRATASSSLPKHAGTTRLPSQLPTRCSADRREKESPTHAGLSLKARQDSNLGPTDYEVAVTNIFRFRPNLAWISHAIAFSKNRKG
jgi:hypothetical protein